MIDNRQAWSPIPESSHERHTFPFVSFPAKKYLAGNVDIHRRYLRWPGRSNFRRVSCLKLATAERTGQSGDPFFTTPSRRRRSGISSSFRRPSLSFTVSFFVVE